tara:strand:+ start:609 stop:1199 length:591 start_codon:yes stop_codon:yes gene_type:complete
MDFAHFFDNINFELEQPGVGKVLISEPFMSDPNFSRSVVLLTEHNEDGSVGFVLNHQSDYKLSDFLPQFKDIDLPLYIGGPVGTNQLFYFHTLSEEMMPGSYPIVEGLSWGGDFNQLEFYIKNDLLKPDQVRFFAGYSGWAPDQLTDEIKEKAWIVTLMDKEMAMKNSTDFWKETMETLGNRFKIMSQFPEDPSLN